MINFINDFIKILLITVHISAENINSIIKLRYPDPVIIDIQGIFFTFVLLLLYTCGGFFFSFLSIYVFIWVGWLLVVCPGLSSYSLST